GPPSGQIVVEQNVCAECGRRIAPRQSSRSGRARVAAGAAGLQAREGPQRPTGRPRGDRVGIPYLLRNAKRLELHDVEPMQDTSERPSKRDVGRTAIRIRALSANQYVAQSVVVRITRRR